MAHFICKLEGARGEASRLGNKKSGVRTTAAGWKGAIQVYVWHDEDTGEDMYRVELTPWRGSGGQTRELARGELDARA